MIHYTCYILRYHFSHQRGCFSCFLTWHDVSKSDGGHGDEAEVEGLEKGPAIPPKNINTILDK